jgi:hypothetical protein
MSDDDVDAFLFCCLLAVVCVRVVVLPNNPKKKKESVRRARAGSEQALASALFSTKHKIQNLDYISLGFP